MIPSIKDGVLISRILLPHCNIPNEEEESWKVFKLSGAAYQESGSRKRNLWLLEIMEHIMHQLTD
jgi:hypothetical protein